MTIRFHLSDDLLLRYSAGTLDESSSLLVASHLALCPHCRARNAQPTHWADNMLDSLPEASVPPSMMESVLARVRCDEEIVAPAITVIFHHKRNDP